MKYFITFTVIPVEVQQFKKINTFFSFQKFIMWKIRKKCKEKNTKPVIPNPKGNCYEPLNVTFPSFLYVQHFLK